MKPITITISNYNCLVCGELYETSYLARQCHEQLTAVVNLTYHCGRCGVGFTTEIGAIRCGSCAGEVRMKHEQKIKLANKVLFWLFIALVGTVVIIAIVKAGELLL